MTDRRAEPIFNAIHDIYDNINFVRGPAERLVVNAKLAPGQQVLDVACGTGWATMAAAWAVGDTGRVTGIDIADKLLDVAKEKAMLRVCQTWSIVWEMRKRWNSAMPVSTQ